MERLTLGVIVGNRDFFPDVLVSEARRDLLALFAEMGIEAVLLDEQATKLGAVETWEHAKRCAELFRANRDRIGGQRLALDALPRRPWLDPSIRFCIPCMPSIIPIEVSAMFLPSGWSYWKEVPTPISGYTLVLSAPTDCTPNCSPQRCLACAHRLNKEYTADIL